MNTCHLFPTESEIDIDNVESTGASWCVCAARSQGCHGEASRTYGATYCVDGGGDLLRLSSGDKNPWNESSIHMCQSFPRSAV